MDNKAVNTLATPTGQGASRWRPIYSTVAVFALSVGAGSAQAGPEGGHIVAGQGSINRAGSDVTVISQQSHRLGIDWNTFNVAANESVVFQQPNSSSIALNRILDHNPSQILGAIDANGQVFLINPSGIVFGESARVNLHSIVASSLDISTEDFMSGNYDLKALSERAGGLVVNRGLIQAATGGSVTLVGGSVANEGLIVADYGQVNLAAGNRATLDFDGDRLMLFEVSEEILENTNGEAAAVSNSGTIQANGGQVLLTGSAASDVFGSVVNNTGVIRAGRIENVGGEVRLVAAGGTVLNSGNIDVSGTLDGGRVELLGDRVGVFDGAQINADGATGGGTVLIGGSLQGADPDVMNANRTYIGATTSISADATVNGDGGTIIAWSEEVTRVYGDLSASGGAQGGDGGFVETSSRDYLDVRRTPDVTAPNGNGGTWLIDPHNIDIVAIPMTCEFFADCPPGPVDFTTNAEGAQLSVDVIANALSGGANVIITTADPAGPADMELGDITWANGVNLDFDGGGGGTLTLNALNNISISGNISDAGGLVPANAGNESLSVFLNAVGNVTVNGTISLLDGTLNVGSMVMPIGGNFNLGSTAVLNSSGFNVFADGDLMLEGTVAMGLATIATSVNLNAGLADAGSTILLDFAAFTDVDTASVTGGGGQDLFTVAAFFGGNLNGGAMADTFTLTTGTVGGAINGNAGVGDRLVGANVVNTWALTGLHAGTVTGVTGGFTNITVVEGGAMTDNFTISGGFGAAPPNVSMYGFVQGGDGADMITFEPGGTVTSINGSTTALGNDGDVDTLVLANVANTVSLDGSFNGVVSNAQTGGTGIFAGFTNMDTVTGGSMVDTYTLTNAPAPWLGSINGGGGNDIFNLDTNMGGAVAGNDGDDTFNFNFATFQPDSISGGNDNDTFNFLVGTVSDGGAPITVNGNDGNDSFVFSGGLLTGSIDGGTGINSLTAANNAMNTWALNAAAGGTVTDVSVGFSNITNVTGGSMVDNFTITAAWGGNVSGGAGNDTFTISGAGNVVGALAGGDDNDTFNFNTAAMLAPGSIAGGMGNDIFNFNSGTVSTAVSGNEGDDDFNFNTANAASGALNGNDGDDDYVFADGSTLTAAGTIDGGANSDTLNWGAYTSAIGLTLTNSDVNGFDGTESVTNMGGFVDMESFLAAMVASTLTAPDTVGGNTWVFDMADDFTLNAARFTGFGTVIGGSTNDAFTIMGGSLSGSLNGMGGTNSLTGNAGLNNWALNMPAAGTVNGIAGGFSNITNVTGGSMVDNFDITGAWAGNVSGGAGNDTFTISGAGNVVGALAGGDDNDTFNFNTAAILAPGSIAGGMDNDIFNFNSGTVSTAVSGNEGDDDFNINAANAASGALNGDAGDDDYVFADGSTLTAAGTINGGANSDTLNWSAYTSAIGLTLTNSDVNGFDGTESVTNMGGFVDMESFLAAMVASTLTAPDTVGGNTWVFDMADDFTLNAARFTGFGTVIGGSTNDMFTLMGGSLSGSLNGGLGGTNTLAGNAGLNNWVLNAPAAGTVNGIAGGFSNIAVVAGGSMVDNFDITGAWAGNVSGGDGSDVFTLNGGTVGGLLNGDGDTDTLVAGNANNAWALTGPGAGTVTGLTNPFSSIEVATGNGMADTFMVSGAFGGAVNGGAGSDTVNWTMFGPISFTLAGVGSVDGFAGSEAATLPGGLDNINVLVNEGVNDTFTASNIVNTWMLNGTNDFDLNGTIWMDFANVNGGSMMDTFTVSAAWGGNVTGGAGDDAFALAGGTIGGMLDGNAGVNTLTAGNVANMWTLAGAASGTVTGITSGFANIANAVGGSNVDAFTVAGAWAGNVSGGLDNDTFTLTTGTVGGVIDGNGGTDSLTAANVANSWNLTGATAGTVTGVTGGFTNINNVTGGTMVDAFTVSGAFGGNVSAGNGNDTIALSGGTLAGAFDGGAGTDTLTAGNVVNSWDLLGATNGTVTGIAGGFTNTENVAGGSNADAFIVSGAWAGNIGGGLGNDSVTLTTGTVGGSVNGDGGTDTLTAANVVNAWNLTGATAGTVTGITGGFTNINNVTGGTMTDNFTVSGAFGGNVSGAGGDDSFTLTAGTIGGAIDGGAGVNVLTAANTINTWDLNGAASGTVTGVAGGFANIANVTGGSMADDYTVSGAFAGNVNGGAGDDVFTLTTGTVGGAIDGGAGVNLLTAANTLNTWALTGPAAGTVSGITGGFMNIANVTGGSMADNFTITGMWAGNVSGGSGDDAFSYMVTGDVAGVVSGDAGDDSVSFAGLSAARNLVLGDGSFVTVENYAGNVGSSITGENVANMWLLDSIDGGTVSNVGGTSTFTGFAAVNAGTAGDTVTVAAGNVFGGAVTGGIGADAFVLLDGASITGALDGATGSDTLDWTAYTTGRTVTLQGMMGSLDGQAGTVAMSIAAGFDNIDVFLASGINDTLVAADIANTWVIDGADAFSLNGDAYSNFANLTGGADTDDFSIAGGTLTGAIDGGAGANTLTGDNVATLWSITGPAAGSTASIAGGFANIGAVTGGTGVDTFNLVSDFTGALNGGDGSDAFNLLAGSMFGELNGGAGSDTLTGNNAATTWILGAAGTGTVGGQAFASFESVVGGDAVDTVSIDANFAGTVNTGGGDDSVTFNTGGAAISVLGGMGTDTLIGTADNDAFVIAATDAGTVNGNIFAEMENLDGGVGNDAFTVDGAAGRGISGIISGGAGNDALNVDYAGADSRTLTFAGGAGMDRLVVTGGGAGFMGTFEASSGGLAYTGGGNTQTIATSEIEGIEDTVFADSLTVNGSAGDDVIELGTGIVAGTNPVRIAVAGSAPIDSANKTDLVVAGGDGNDSINVATDVVLAGALELNAETVANGGGSITAALLRLVNTSMAGVGNALQTVIDTLQISGASGDANIEDAGDLVLAASDSTGNVSVTATGGITQSGALAVGGTSAFSGTAITLANAGNDFGGAVALTGGNATIVDSNALTLGAATLTGNLNATAASGNLSSVDALSVAGTTGLIATGGDIVLSNAANSFTGALSLTAANNATVNAASALALGAANVGGNYSATSAGNIAVQQLLAAGGNVTLAAGGTLAEAGAGAITGTGLTASSTGGMTLNGSNAVAALSATNSGGNMQITNTAGNLNVTALTQSGTGTTALTNTGGLTLSGPVTAGSGAVTLTATQSIAQNSNITVAGGDLTLKADTGITMLASSSARTQGGDIGYCTESGDVSLALLDASSGNVVVKSVQGGIASINGVTATNIVGTQVTLNASGTIGSQQQSITVDAPGGAAGLITFLNTRASQVFVANKNNTQENNQTTATVVDFGAAAAIAAFQAGQSSSLQDVGFVDLALFSPDVTLINTVGNGLLLPCDQLDDEEARCQ